MLKRTSRRLSTLATLTALATFVAPTALHAQTDETTRVKFSGFGTLGVVHTQGDGAAFVRDMSQFHGATNRGLFWETDTRLGIQAAYAATETLDIVTQVISRYNQDNNFDPEVSLGFVRYAPNPSVKLRLGRVGYDIFHAADSREVGYSYLWVRPPLEYYGAMSTQYIDGGDVTFLVPIGNNVARLKLYSGLARNRVPNLYGQNRWAGNISADLGVMQDLAGTRFTGGLIDFDAANWMLRLSRSNMRVLKEIPPGPIDTLALLRNTAQGQSDAALANGLFRLAEDIAFAGKKLTFDSVGLIYDKGPLRADLAIYHLKSTSLMFGELWAGYWTLGYRFDKLTPFVNIAAVRSKNPNRTAELHGRGVDAAVSVADFMLTRADQHRQALTLGLRYDWKTDVALKFQVDAIRNKTCSPVSLPLVGSAAPCSPPLLLPSVPVDWNGRANVFSATLDFIF